MAVLQVRHGRSTWLCFSTLRGLYTQKLMRCLPPCHSLVRPLLNGREVGYFILDTGASG